MLPSYPAECIPEEDAIILILPLVAEKKSKAKEEWECAGHSASIGLS